MSEHQPNLAWALRLGVAVALGVGLVLFPVAAMVAALALALGCMITAALVVARRPQQVLGRVQGRAAAMWARVPRSRRPLVVVAVTAAALVGLAWWFFGGDRLAAPLQSPTFRGVSTQLRRTRVAATLDEPLASGENVVWCASFAAAWKTLAATLAGGRVQLDESPTCMVALNRAPDPRPHVPGEALYTAAGWHDKGILEEIAAGLRRKFPEKEPPQFDGIPPDSFVAYAYLEANVRFARPYFQSREPMLFVDRSGRETQVNSFGIRRRDKYGYRKLRRQPSVLYRRRDETGGIDECVIDLDRTSAPSQLLVALVEPDSTLRATYDAVREKIASGRPASFLTADELLVPDMVWAIQHDFTELIGQRFTNPSLFGRRIDIARQDIYFRLDRTGAELRSESKVVAMCKSARYIFNRPFLLCMRKRGAEEPYFVMWVDNAELLKGWDEG